MDDINLMTAYHKHYYYLKKTAVVKDIKPTRKLICLSAISIYP